MLIAPLIYAGPQLVSDVRVNGQWTIAYDLKIKEFKCTQYYFLVSTCNIEYINRVEPDRAGGTLSYLVFGSWSGERGMLLRSTTEPQRISATIGIEHMQQRLITLSIFALLGPVALMFMLFRALVSNRSEEPEAARKPELPKQPEPKANAYSPATPMGGQSFGRRSSKLAG